MNEPYGNLDRLNQLVADSEFDAVVAVSPENVPYTCGVFIWSQRGIRERLALTVLPKEGDPTLIICTIEEPQTKTETFINDLRTYVEFRTSPIEVLANVLHEKGLANGNIGIELGYLSARYWEELKTRVPNATFGDCEEIFDHARMIKTPREIELLTKAGRGTERALLATYSTIRSGESEKSMAERLSNNVLLTGADSIEFLYINAGPNTGYPHSDASDYQCKPGDIIKADVGGLYGGYTSDVARTAVIGSASAEQKSIYSRLLEVHHECIALARPGNRAKDIFAAMTDGMKRVDLHFPLSHGGHSVGMTPHETPMLSPIDETEFQPNMTLYVETRVRWPGEAGYHVEDLILVTDGTPKALTGFYNIDELLEL